MNRQSSPVFLFIPSPEDIRQYEGDDTYFCGLAEVRKEVDSIVDSLQKEFYDIESVSDRRAIPRLSVMEREEAGNTPELIVQVGALFASGAVTTLLYRLISEWIKNRNGRKFRVKLPDGLEIEATQLRQNEFEPLVELMHERYCSGKSFYDNEDKLKRLGLAVSKSGLNLPDRELQAAYSSKLKQLTQRPEVQKKRMESND